jgi:hypothetical protein
MSVTRHKFSAPAYGVPYIGIILEPQKQKFSKVTMWAFTYKNDTRALTLRMSGGGGGGEGGGGGGGGGGAAIRRPSGVPRLPSEVLSQALENSLAAHILKSHYMGLL